MFKQESIALALVAAFALATAGGAIAGDKKHSDNTQGSGAAAQSSAQQDNGSKEPETHPGQAEAPGHSGTAPGQAGATPGQSGTSPGQAGTTPGQSGNTPGKQRHQSSQSDTGSGTANDATAGRPDPGDRGSSDTNR